METLDPQTIATQIATGRHNALPIGLVVSTYHYVGKGSGEYDSQVFFMRWGNVVDPSRTVGWTKLEAPPDRPSDAYAEHRGNPGSGTNVHVWMPEVKS